MGQIPLGSLKAQNVDLLKKLNEICDFDLETYFHFLYIL